MFKLGSVSIDSIAYGSQGSAILGIRDSGKTYTATWLAEKIFDAGIPFVAFDPIGVWRFLRIPGKGKGYPVVVAGGQEGDLPLTVNSAPEIVRAAMQNGVSLVIDLFDINLSKADWKRIVTACVRVLLHENSKHGLRHIFIEEAAEFAPQRVGPDQGQVYAEIEKLARMGGNSRLGYTLVNQRAEEVNKAVLELCDNLFLHRQKGRNSLTALSKWLDIGNVKESHKIIDTLSTLETGKCWAWMQGSEMPILVKVPEKNSLHPDRRIMRGDKDVKLKSAVDVGSFITGMKKSLVDVEKEAELNDPKKLRAQIAELKKKAPAVDPNMAEQAEKKGYQNGWLEGYEKAIAECIISFDCARATLASMVFEMIGKAKFEIPKIKLKHKIPTGVSTARPLTQLVRSISEKKIAPTVPVMHNAVSDDISRSEQKIIDAISFWIGVDTPSPTRAQVAVVAGYRVTSGGYGNLLSKLSIKGVINYPAPNCVGLAAGLAGASMSAEQAKQKLMGTLSNAQRKIIDAFDDKAATREEIAERTGYRPTSGGYGNLLSSLSVLGILTRPAPGSVNLADWVREIL